MTVIKPISRVLEVELLHNVALLAGQSSGSAVHLFEMKPTS